jgi:OFA family oxalate/formate antiporter-like MFS transporter
MTVMATPAVRANRWSQLWLGVVCMVLIANLQYGWTLFVNPMHNAHGWGLGDIQLAFSIFIATETWLTPIEGWIVDYLGPRRGPPIMIAFGAVLVGLALVINAYATSLPMLYVGAAVSGTGAGAIYATCVGNAVKWFHNRRGLAVGLTAGGFGAGAAFTVIPIRMMIEGLGYADTFFWFGLRQGAVLLLIAPIMRGPMAREMPATAPPKVQQSTKNSTPLEVLRSPIFWLLYVMLTAISASGLIVTAQIAAIAQDFGLSKEILMLGATVLSVALVVDSIMNGMSRPFFGWVSDNIGRENTMAIAFTLGGLSYLLLGYFGNSPWAFVLCAALIFFRWGEIFSLFPSTCTDLFGTKFATTNAMLLYTAKGTSAWLVPLANLSKASAGSWHTVFLTAAVVNLAVVLAALFVLKPIRKRG